jgi:6-phosphogluconate dehydrogenase (decarboxylating)
MWRKEMLIPQVPKKASWRADMELYYGRVKEMGKGDWTVEEGIYRDGVVQ